MSALSSSSAHTRVEAGPHAASRAGRGAFGRVWDKLQPVHATLRASAWAALVGRAALFALGLLVLAWIGRVATAAPIVLAGTQLVGARADGADGGAIDPRGSMTAIVDRAALAAGNGAAASTIAPTMIATPSILTPAVGTPLTPAVGTPSSTPAVGTPSSTPAPSGSRATPEDPVFVNHASAEQLRRLPGVGPKRAEAIVALRQRVGRFQRVEDLLRVKGVGRTTLRKWRPLVRLDAPPAPVVPAEAARPDGGPP